MDITATEIMRRNVQTVPPTMSLPDLEQAFITASVSGFPVVENGQLVGVVSRSDIVRQMQLEQQTASRTSDFYRDASGFHELPPANNEEVWRRIGERLQKLTVADVMHRQIIAVSPEQTLKAIAETMLDNDIHRVLVTHHGQLLGVVSATDFVRLYAQGRLRPA